MLALVLVFAIVCPCIAIPVPILCCIMCICCIRKNKGGKRKKALKRGRTRNQRFGRAPARSGVISLSPGGSKKGKAPPQLGSSGKKGASLKK